MDIATHVVILAIGPMNALWLHDQENFSNHPTGYSLQGYFWPEQAYLQGSSAKRDQVIVGPRPLMKDTRVVPTYTTLSIESGAGVTSCVMLPANIPWNLSQKWL